VRFHTDSLFDTEPPDRLCHFGLVSAPLAAFLAGDIGLGAAGGAIGSGLITGAGLGAATAGITGGDPLKGALGGALTGGAIGGAGAAGLGAAGQAAVGAGAGALGAGITGQDPLTGALTGGAAGLISGSGALGGGGPLSSGPTSTVTPSSALGASGGTGAASTAPASIAAPTGGPATDLTAAATSAGGSSMPYDLTSNLLNSPDIGVGQGSLVSRTTTPVTGGGVIDRITGGGDTFGKIGSFVEKNPGLVLGAGALGAQALMGSQPSKYENQLSTAAGEAGTMARTLSTYQLTGTLPSGLQSVVDRYQNNAISTIKSQYAQLGLSGSTAEAQAIAGVKQTSAIQVAELADKLATQGIKWEALSHDDMVNLLKAEQSRDQSFTQALTTFASGLAGAKLGGT
jgi:hypothetical protein